MNEWVAETDEEGLRNIERLLLEKRAESISRALALDIITHLRGQAALARKAALEEAAKRCDAVKPLCDTAHELYRQGHSECAKELAKAIRALSLLTSYDLCLCKCHDTGEPWCDECFETFHVGEPSKEEV